MNQSSSKFHKQKCPTALPENRKILGRKQQQQGSRSPLQDLNNGGIGRCSNDNSSSNTSIEAPKGCLRFFLSHSSFSSSSTKTPGSNNGNNHRPTKAKPFSSKTTPKSAPNIRPTKENSSKRTIFHKPISTKLEKVKRNPPSCLYEWQSGKKPRNVPNSKTLDCGGSLVKKMKSGSGELKHLVVNEACDGDAANLTPLSKVASGSGLNSAFDDGMVIINGDDEKSYTDTKTNSSVSSHKTPPVQVSISPEIQCATSMISTAKTTTPACYAAGHVLSGVNDKRKCRPRGILTVGEAKALCSFDSDDDTGQENSLELVSNSSVSMMPFPTEASMNWLLSPCNEKDEDQKENSEEGLYPFQRLEQSATPNSPASPSSGKNRFWFGSCNYSNSRSTSNTSTRRRKSASLLSPTEHLEYKGFQGSPVHDDLVVSASDRKRENCYNLDGENSPFSIDSLGCGNVIQTPKSNSSSDRQVGMSWLSADGSKECNFDPELDLVTEHLQMTSLSPKNHISIWDPARSSFQFDCLTPSSNSVDLSRFPQILDDQASQFPNSMLETVSQSQMRISWREGLVSRIFEMDEFDFCRCLSDEEDDANCCSNYCLKPHWSPVPNVDAENNQHSTNGFGSTEFVNREHGIDEKGKDGLPPQEPCSCAESISTDGGGLVRSDDSDWTLCYKNQLFQV